MNLFLISGKAGSGKNEVALIIKESLDKTIITSFSKYIKLFALELTDWDGRDFDKPRQFLQEMGDKLRAIDEDFLTEEELLIVMRARNHKNNSHPRNTDIITYKNATGLEALIGYLYLKDNLNRLTEIMNYIKER